MTVTQYSPIVILNTAALAALTALQAQLSGIVRLNQLQFRVSTGGLGGGQLYTCVSLTGNALSLDRVIQEPSGVNVGYQLYRAYVQPPSPDFIRWESFDDFANGFAITGDRLTRTRQEFDRRDPQRQSQGLAYFLGYLKADNLTGTSPCAAPNGQLQTYELWPHPTSGQAFVVTYKRQGLPFSQPTDTQPSVILDSLIMDRALGWHGYPWVQANRGSFPQYAKTDLMALIKATRDGYFRQLMDVKRQDDEQGLQSVYSRGRGHGVRSGLAGPADAAFWQRHPITW